MFDVCVVRCESYEQRAVTDALRAVLEQPDAVAV